MLPDQQHCYFLNGDAPVQDGRSLQGALVSKIPFRHPAQVPLLLDIIRHQAAYNNLIASCVKRTSIKEGKCPASDLLFWSVNNIYFCLCVSYVLNYINQCSIFTVVPLDSAGLLQFEVCPLTDSSFSVSFQHPVNESLVCGEYSVLKKISIIQLALMYHNSICEW